jgi:tripartite-type tricarboxylate transporter receptor subunit TctC
MRKTLRSTFGAAIGLLLATASALVSAQAYPDRPIRLIVPIAAGGSSDTFARGISQKLGEALGQSIIVDNRPGASSIIGHDVVAKAAPDGYTLLLASTSLTVNPACSPSCRMR